MIKERVVHCKKEEYDVYIGRPGKWGNPFMLHSRTTRKKVIEDFREWVVQQPKLMADLHELEGKTLGCWCAPKACHGDVLIELLHKKSPG